MGRPKKIKVEEPPIITREYVKPLLREPSFGYPRPAPKPSAAKKAKSKENSLEVE